MNGYSQDLRDRAIALYQTGFNDKQAILNYLQEHPDADGIELRNKLAPHVSQSCFYNTLELTH